MVVSTVSIQKIAAICKVWAFGALAAAWPSKKAMLSTPPPKSGGVGAVEMIIAIVLSIFCLATTSLSNLFGLSNNCCVIVPAAIKLLRSCGILGVFGLVAVWLANLILFAGFAVWNGVMSTGFMSGAPATSTKLPCASMVVPCGIDAMRVTVSPSAGRVVDGT